MKYASETTAAFPKDVSELNEETMGEEESAGQATGGARPGEGEPK
jgi:hypothetical protein